MPIIAATRRGFLYQDRVAIAVYLERFQKKTLRKFYIDYPVSARRSLDIRLLEKESNEDRETLFEVKSGEEFKKNKKTKGSPALREALIVLRGNAQKSGVELRLIIRKGIRGKIARYWADIKQLQERPFIDPPTKQLSKKLFVALSLPGIRTVKDLYDFCQSFALEDYDDDVLSSEVDEFPDIDDFVLTKINDLARLFDAAECREEYPDCVLMFDLYHYCRLHAGSGADVHPIFQSRIHDFFTRRRFLSENPHRIPKKDKRIISDEIGKRIEMHFGASTPPVLSPDAQLEGTEYAKT